MKTFTQIEPRNTRAGLFGSLALELGVIKALALYQDAHDCLLAHTPGLSAEGARRFLDSKFGRWMADSIYGRNMTVEAAAAEFHNDRRGRRFLMDMEAMTDEQFYG